MNISYVFKSYLVIKYITLFLCHMLWHVMLHHPLFTKSKIRRRRERKRKKSKRESWAYYYWYWREMPILVNFHAIEYKVSIWLKYYYIQEIKNIDNYYDYTIVLKYYLKFYKDHQSCYNSKTFRVGQ